MLHKVRKALKKEDEIDLQEKSYILARHKCPLILDKLKNIYHFYFLLRVKHIGTFFNDYTLLINNFNLKEQ